MLLLCFDLLRAVSKKKDGANKEATAAKPKKAAALPLPEMMQQEIIPPLKDALEAEDDVSQVQLAFQNNTVSSQYLITQIQNAWS